MTLSAVIWLKYCRFGVKHYPINQYLDVLVLVCYNESGEDQLEAFTEELEKEGKLSEDTKVLMKEITEKKPTKEKTADQSNNIKVSRDD